MSTQQKETFYENKVRLQDLTTGLEAVRVDMEKIARAWLTLETEIKLTPELLKTFYDARGKAQPEVVEQMLLREKAKKSPLAGSGMSDTMVMNMMVKPDITPIIAPLVDFRGWTSIYDNGIYWHVYRIDGDVVTMDEEAVKGVTASFRATVEGPAEEKRYKLAEKLKKALEEILEEYPEIPPSSLSIPGLIEGSTSGLQILPDFVKYARVRGERMLFNNQNTAPQGIAPREPSRDGFTYGKHADGDPLSTEASMGRLLAEKRNKENPSGIQGKRI